MNPRLKELIERIVAVPRDNTSSSEKHELYDLVQDLYRENLRMHAALRMLDQWDILNPPISDVLSDAAWCRQVVDDGLGKR